MYIENIQTPHPALVREGEHTQPLALAARLEDARTSLHREPDNDALRWGIVARVTEAARQSLRYPDNDFMPKQGGSNEFDTLRNEQITTCLGYAAVSSECLDVVGVDHYITYAENHWMLAVPNARNTRLRIADVLFKEANQDITDYLSRGTPMSIRQQVDELRRGTAMLTSSCIYFPDEQPRDSEYTNVVSFYGPADGRDIMHTYSAFLRSVTKRNLAEATDALHCMRGIYPEVDARAPHLEVRRLVKDLCALGDFAMAAQAVDDYCLSFAPSKDARLKELEGDLLRHITKASQDPTLADRSTAAYEEALSRRRMGSLDKYTGKLQAARRLAELVVAA